MRAAALAVAKVAALAMAVAACGGGRAERSGAVGHRPAATLDAGVDAAPDPAVLAGIADGLVETLATMAAITTDSGDCPTMAAGLERLFDQATELFALARAQAADPLAARLLTAAMEERGPAVGPLVERIERGLARCQHDPAVARAMERMPTL